MEEGSFFCSGCRQGLSIKRSDIENLSQHEHSQSHRYHEDYEDFMEAIENRCYFCTRMWEELSAMFQAPELTEFIRDQRRWRGLSFLLYSIYESTRMFANISVWKDGKLCLTDYTIVLFEGKFFENGSLKSISRESSSPLSLGLAHQWYMSCRSLHKTCRQLIKTPKWLPTRLMDIGISENRWKLHFSAEDGPISPNYVTLSYRWGSKPCLKLSRSNMQELRQGQPISELSQLFRDAIFIARRFSIRYIWIDSICILQDFPEDWKQEAGTMRDVYANAAFSISAAAAVDPYDTLFRSREPQDVLPGIFKANLDSTKQQSCLIYERDYWYRHLEQAQLNKRGWVLQERLLAARVLHFTENQIFWECFTDQKCECYPSKFLHYRRLKDFSALFSESQKQQLLDDPPRMSDATFHKWNEIAGTYSRCDITIPSDKLPALSGIAKLFQETTGDTYLAGIWKSRLIDSLTWRVSVPAAKRLLSQYQAPSWSWAASEGRLITHFEGNVNLISVVDAQVLTNFGDNNEQGFGGYLVVDGVLFEGLHYRIEEQELDRFGYWREIEWLQIGDYDVSVRASPDSADVLAHDGMPVTCLILGCVHIRNLGYPDSREEVMDDSGKEMFVAEGLFLKPVDNSHGSYHRIAYFQFEMSDEELLEIFGICVAVTGDLEYGNYEAIAASWTVATSNIRIV